jgi:CRISPR-associated protein Cas1
VTKHSGMIRPDLQALPQVKDRMTFLYLEHCTLERQDGAITVTDENGVVHIPAAAISVLLLGPGTRVTHRAMELMGDTGVGAVWVGEHGVRYYAHGRPLTTRANLLIRQAELVSNTRKHLDVVRKMYQLRFPDENVAHLTMQQLRGREGSRVRNVYRAYAKETGVAWSGRVYNPDDFSSGDAVNQALSAGHACLYGLAHAVIVALGCAPGLGFIHVGHERSFVYDIADLYKSEITIPIAFQTAAEAPEDLPAIVRRRVRDAMVSARILERMVHDIRWLLSPAEESMELEEAIYLWDNQRGVVSNGINYFREEEGDGPLSSSP